jgi:hypothetical protein
VVEGEVTAERVDDHTLSVSASRGFFHDPFSQVFRSPALPFHVGDVSTVKGMRVEIMEADAAGIPRRIQFHFDSALDDPALSWVTWDHQTFVPFKPPRAGEKVSVASTSLAEVLTGKK